ncbi:MAG TPA: hypothetical protein VF649_13065 [Sphingomonas sp.]|jgi:tetratricopeptide (TPR) repeat protein
MLLAAMCAGPAWAATAWQEARTDHFIVYAAGDAQSVRDYATRLERYDKGLHVFRGLESRPSDHANPVIVFVVPNVDTVQRLCAGGRKKTGCGEVYGFYNTRPGRSVAFTPRRSGEGKYDLNAQTVLFHEYAHHFMFANYSGAYPAWFTEGFAEFNGTARFEKDGGIGFGIPAMHRAYGLVSGKPLSLEAMLTADNRKLDPQQRDALYGRGWLLTHYLTFAPERREQLSRYLQALNGGKPSLDAARSAFGDLKQLDRDLDRYLMKSQMSYLPLRPASLPIGPIAVRTLGPGEAAMLPVVWRSKRGVDKAEAAQVVIEARRIAAPFADDPAVQGALAEAEYDAGHLDLADAAADRALAADPANRQALLYKGRIALRRAADARSADPAVWRAARGWFVKANRLDPDDAEPLMLFYDSFHAAGAKPTDNAVIGLLQAFDLAPQDEGLRFRAATEYLRKGDRAEARRILAPLAFNPHAAPDNAASQLIALIDKGDAKAIDARIDAAPDAADGT